MKHCDDFKPLLVGQLDGELTPEEAYALNEHLVRCAGCRAEYERLRETTGRLQALSYQEPGDVVLAQVWKSPYSRCARNAALFLVLAGYLFVTGYALFAFLNDRGSDPALRIAIAAIVTGFTILLVQAIRERVKTYQTDPYKEIQR